MKKIELEKAAEISSGLVVQRFTNRKGLKVEDEPAAKKLYYYTTLKSVEDNKIDLSLLERVELEKEVKPNYLLRKGDIIMKLSSPFSAARVDFECENLLVSSHFAVIRVKDNFDPKYLSFILNGRYVRNQLNRLVEGGMLSIIKISYLKKVKIRFRNKDEQQKYGKLLSLLLRRNELKKRELELEELIMEDILSNL